MMFRVVLEFGEGVPTRVFGGDYPTQEAALRAKKNVESTTHYKARIEMIETEEPCDPEIPTNAAKP